MIRHPWLPPLGMLSCALFTAWLTAQEPPVVDPFGDTKETPKAAPAPAEPKKKAAPPKVETDPIVLGIRASNPQTPTEIMQAVIDLTNYGRVDEAKRYTSALVLAKLDDATSWQLQRKFGTAPLIRLSMREDIQPEGKQLADMVLDGSNRFVRDPARLETLIKQLANTQPELRHIALVDLKEAGSDAVVGIIKALNDSSRAAEHSLLRAGLVQMGSISIGPLLGALNSPQEELRAQILVVLGQLAATDGLPFLMRPYFAAPAGSTEQQAAQAALSRMMKDLPTKAAAERLLLRLVTEYFHGRLPGEPDHENRIELWQWDNAQQQPVRVWLDPISAPTWFAARLASELVALAPANREYQRWYLAAILDSAKLVAGWERPIPQGAGTAFALAAAQRDSWDDVLAFALAKGHTAAGVALLEVIGATGDASVVQSSGGQPREVVKALRNSSRRVQFAALQAIMRIAPREPFAGASYVPESLGFFTRTAGSRRVLIAHPRIELSQSLAGFFRESGIESELTTNGAQSLQSSLQNADFEFVLLSDGLDRPNVQELVGQFRREPRMARMPLGILARPENFDRLRRALAEDPLTEVFALPTDAAGVSFVMRRLLERVERDWVPHAERIKQANAALDYLAELAEYPAETGFYELLPQQSAVELALTVPALSKKAARVLGFLGTPPAQRALTQFANQTGRTLDDRQAAAAAFDIAVKRRGLLLTKSEILRQFDIYNASANSDAGTQQVLRAILDTIDPPSEANAAREDTPE